MEFEVWLTVVILRLIDIVMQCTGIYLLTINSRMEEKNKPLNERNIQPLYILNLSITELSFSILWLFVLPIHLIDNGEHSFYGQHIVPIFLTAIVSFIQMSYFATMFSITLDRLVAVKLSVKYGIYWNWKKAKHMLILIWVLSAILFIVMLLLKKYTRIKFTITLNLYLYTPLNIAFIILAVITYGYIYYEYKKSIVMILQAKRLKLVGEVPDNACLMFLKSKFKITLMIVVTFIIFQGLPTLSYVFTNSINHKTDCSESIRAILYPIGNIMDCCIYIFFKPKIRELFCQKLNIKPKIKTKTKKDKLLSIKAIQEEIMDHNFTIQSINAIHEQLMKMHVEDASLELSISTTWLNREASITNMHLVTTQD